jgi:AcrR family transcriptional regulator
MMPLSKATRERILIAAYAQFYKNGYARVSMDAIALAAGVTKRSVYYHFESKDALVHAALENQRDQALDLVRSWGNASVASPKDFVTRLFAHLDSWSRGENWTGSGYTRLTMELADLPGHPARQTAREHKKSVELWLSAKLSDLGVRHADQTAREIMILIEGTMSLSLIHGPANYAQAAADAAKILIDHRTG